MKFLQDLTKVTLSEKKEAVYIYFLMGNKWVTVRKIYLKSKQHYSFSGFYLLNAYEKEIVRETSSEIIKKYK